MAKKKKKDGNKALRRAKKAVRKARKAVKKLARKAKLGKGKKDKKNK